MEFTTSQYIEMERQGRILEVEVSVNFHLYEEGYSMDIESVTFVGAVDHTDTPTPVDLPDSEKRAIEADFERTVTEDQLVTSLPEPEEDDGCYGDYARDYYKDEGRYPSRRR